MKEYSVDDSVKKRIFQRIRSSSLRWRIGNIIAAVVLIIWSALVFEIVLRKDEIGADVFPVIVFASILPVLIIIFSLIIARSAGSDVFSGRIGEKLYFTDNAIILAYTPRFKEIEPATLIEEQIYYKDIVEITHNKREYCYIVHGLVQIEKIGQHEQLSLGLEQHTGCIRIYEYFVDMNNIITTLTQQCKIEIREVR